MEGVKEVWRLRYKMDIGRSRTQCTAFATAAEEAAEMVRKLLLRGENVEIVKVSTDNLLAGSE